MDPLSLEGILANSQEKSILHVVKVLQAVA